MYKRKFTPERINDLKENEIFVFGSNLAGLHGGGAARLAYDRFGAVWRQGVGLQGQSYAIPTMQGGVETIKPYVDEFIEFAGKHPEMTFYVTKIGCGIAGFKDQEIAPLFAKAIDIENIILPESFVNCISNSQLSGKAMNSKGIIGAIIGDIVGSRFEFNNHRSTEFEMFAPNCEFTDDSVMTIAVAHWLRTKEKLSVVLRKFGNKYPWAGYGGMFVEWLAEKDGSPLDKPYNSFGNGAGMRVSPCGFFACSLEEALDLARKSAEVTHNHPEGIKGAESIAAAIYLARMGHSKSEIRKFIELKFGYNLNRSCDEIRPYYEFNETSQDTNPQALIAFFESRDFESAIRLAVSLGGDSDTLACMTGAIAAAYYGVPQSMIDKAVTYLPKEFISEIIDFESVIRKKRLYFDMDGVIVDFESGLAQQSEHTLREYEGRFDEIPGLFGMMQPMPGAIDAVHKLNEYYDCYILSTAPWKNPSAWSDKVKWVTQYLDDVFHKRIVITHCKNLCKGDILIDDRGKNGTSEFEGEWIKFGSKRFPDWDAVLEYLIPPKND